MSKEHLTNVKNAKNVGIYSITTPSRKVYVGMTNDSFQTRWRKHKTLLRNGNHFCLGLYRSYLKYGLENLVFETVEEYVVPDEWVEKEKLGLYILKREKEIWLDYKEKGFVLLNGMPSSTGSVFHTDDTRNKISASLTKHYSNQLKISVKCRKCNKVFSTQNNLKKNCDDCKKRRHNSVKRIKICNALMCHNFIVSTDKYCSNKCKEPSIVFCKNCKKQLIISTKNEYKIFCSPSCSSKFSTKDILKHKKEIISLRKAGMSLREIAKRFDCSYQTVRNYTK